MWRERFRDQTPQERQALGAAWSNIWPLTRTAPPGGWNWPVTGIHRVKSIWRWKLSNGLERPTRVTVHPEIPLLRARCLLEQGDERSFQYLYFKALDTAALTGEFGLLLHQTEAVFSNADYQEWDKFGRDGDRAAFLRRFWVRRHSDRFEPLNTELITHYRRFR